MQDDLELDKKPPCGKFEAGIKLMVLIKETDTIIDSEGRMYVFSDAKPISIPLAEDHNKK